MFDLKIGLTMVQDDSEKSYGLWNYLIDNCGGHELEVTLPSVQILHLPPKWIAKNQSLDLGIIVTSKIRYLSSLLSATLDVLLGRRLSKHGLQSTTGHGK